MRTGRSHARFDTNAGVRLCGTAGSHGRSFGFAADHSSIGLAWRGLSLLTIADLRQICQLLLQKRTGRAHAAKERIQRRELLAIVGFDDSQSLLQLVAAMVDVLDVAVQTIRACRDDAPPIQELRHRLVQLVCIALGIAHRTPRAQRSAGDLQF